MSHPRKFMGSLAISLLLAAAAHAADFSVQPAGETTMMPDILADAADDPAFWLHPTDPARSFIIGTNKLTAANGGLYLYNLDGSQFDSVLGARMNNVDVRYNFTLTGQKVDLVAATDRTHGVIALYTVDAAARSLTPAGSIALDGLADPYGFAMYHSKQTNRHYAFVSDNDNDGTVRQYELFDAGGSVSGALVRQFNVGSTVEGIVADDELGYVYVAQEDVAIWKYGAAPAASATPADRTAVDFTTSGGGPLTADIEGLTLYYASSGAGYLIASSQGASTYFIYKREAGNDFVASFNIVANESAGIDLVTATDGIHVVNGNLGAVPGAYDWTAGLFIAHDDWNIFHTDTSPSGQNFKLVKWSDIATYAGTIPLTIDTTWDPRSIPEPATGPLLLALAAWPTLHRRRPLSLNT